MIIKWKILGYADEIYRKLKNASTNNHFSVYKKANIPNDGITKIIYDHHQFW